MSRARFQGGVTHTLSAMLVLMTPGLTGDPRGWQRAGGEHRAECSTPGSPRAAPQRGDWQGLLLVTACKQARCASIAWGDSASADWVTDQGSAGQGGTHFFLPCPGCLAKLHPSGIQHVCLNQFTSSPVHSSPVLGSSGTWGEDENGGSETPGCKGPDLMLCGAKSQHSDPQGKKLPS